VLSTAGDEDKVAWHENDGEENFSTHNIVTTLNFPNSVYAADIDDDGDIDVLTTSWYNHTVMWCENDGETNFTHHVLSDSAINATSVYAGDINGDGDMDVISASNSDHEIVWFENNGQASFTPHQITNEAYNAESIYANDVDSDGDLDVLSASSADFKIAWYENTQITGIDEMQPRPTENCLAQNYPNPFNPSTRIAFEVQEAGPVRLDIFDIQGRHIYTVLDKEMSAGHHDIAFNNHGLASGVYLYRIEMGDFVAARKMVVSK
jgi:hypothetical protein